MGCSIWGVAMCNSTDQAKAVDAVSTLDNNRDGIAEVIEKYLVSPPNL